MANNISFLDELLDRALARYSVAEPRTGLEQRILARLEAGELEPSPWWRRRWLPVAAAAAVVVAAAVVTTRQPAAPPVPATVASQPTVQPALPVAPPLSVMARPSVPRKGNRPLPSVAALPREPQFPSAGTLTTEERLLQQYLDRVPREALLASVRKQEPLSDLRVSDLEVTPLQVKALPERSGEAMED